MSKMSDRYPEYTPDQMEFRTIGFSSVLKKVRLTPDNFLEKDLHPSAKSEERAHFAYMRKRCEEIVLEAWIAKCPLCGMKHKFGAYYGEHNLLCNNQVIKEECERICEEEGRDMPLVLQVNIVG